MERGHFPIKTYVYLRTIFELNKRYGFTKFVIVVPSIAIKEGVYKSLQITEEHFRALYSGTPVDYFLYDSTKLGQVRNFATSSQIQIMVVTVGAINKKDVNNLYKDSEKTGGEKPIGLIKATRPILIVDEPQSVDGGLAGRGAVPVFTNPAPPPGGRSRPNRSLQEGGQTDPAADRSLAAGLRLAPKKLRPLLHQGPPTFEEVRPRIGRFHLVADHVGQRRLHDRMGRVGRFGRPVAKARPEPMRHGRDSQLPQQAAEREIR